MADYRLLWNALWEWLDEKTEEEVMLTPDEVKQKMSDLENGRE